MKILILSVSIFMCGCEMELNSDDLSAINSICNKNNGVDYIFVGLMSEKVYCKDEARFTISRK